MKAFNFAQKIISTLALDPLLPGYSAITFALADKTQGKLGGYVDSTGNLNVGGIVGNTTLCSGSANVDFSALAGFMKTPTGLFTHNGPVSFTANNTPLASAGTTQGGAAALSARSVQLLSSSNSSDGWILPASSANYILTLINTSSTAGKLYPDTGGTINGGSANASVTVPASTGVRAYCTAALTWFAEELGTLG